jgi:hypothetical protein
VGGFGEDEEGVVVLDGEPQDDEGLLMFCCLGGFFLSEGWL